MQVTLHCNMGTSEKAKPSFVVVVVLSSQEAMELRKVLPLKQKKDFKFYFDLLRLAHHHSCLFQFLSPVVVMPEQLECKTVQSLAAQGLVPS